MENKTSNYSWTLILVLLFVFWPVGLYMLYKKAQTDKKVALTASKIMNTIGTVLIVFGVITVIVGIGVIYIIGGVLLKKMAKKLRNSAENVKRYLAIVVNGNVRQLDAICASVGKPYKTVKEELQKMIDDGYFRNAYIDESTREIVLVQAQPTGNTNYSGGTGTATAVRVVTCPCCGANNTVSGSGSECEYCGSPL